MYQNVISSPYPIINPVQMQAPVSVNMAPNTPMQITQTPPAMPQYQQPPMPFPVQMPAANAVANAVANYNKAMLIGVSKLPNGNFHFAMANPVIKDGNEYEVSQSGTITKYNGFSAPSTVVENCPIMQNAYKMLDSYNAVI